MMDLFFFTGVGSRETPADILFEFEEIRKVLEELGGMPRSGNAPGADKPFSEGPVSSPLDPSHKRQIFLPWKTFEDPPKDPTQFSEEGYYVKQQLNEAMAEQIAEQVIPWWGSLKSSHRQLHGRNPFQVLGPDLESPSRVCVGWSPLDKSGEPTGGTRTAFKIAQLYGVPVVNRSTYETYETFKEDVLRWAQCPKEYRNVSEEEALSPGLDSRLRRILTAYLVRCFQKQEGVINGGYLDKTLWTSLEELLVEHWDRFAHCLKPCFTKEGSVVQLTTIPENIESYVKLVDMAITGKAASMRRRGKEHVG